MIRTVAAAVTLPDEAIPPDHALLDAIRRAGAGDCRALDAATGVLSDREKAFLVTQLRRVATHLATRVGSVPGLPPPETLPGSGSDHLELSAQQSAVPVAAIFVRNTLMYRWGWADLVIEAEHAVREMTSMFVAAILRFDRTDPTRMTLRLRAVSSGRLVIELYDSPANDDIITDTPRLISEHLERLSVRCGRHRSGGRTVVWCEIGRPELSRWI